MRFALTALLTVSTMLSPFTAWAQSSDVEAVITGVSLDNFTIKLDDGKTYQASPEFNFEGLEKGVKVLVFYTVVDGKRVIDDLELVN